MSSVQSYENKSEFGCFSFSVEDSSSPEINGETGGEREQEMRKIAVCFGSSKFYYKAAYLKS